MSRNYIFHIPKTNLASRTDDLAGQSESFLYDNLDRLTKCYTPIRNIAYATNGNISSKTEGGTYTYDATKVHAVTWVTKTAGTSSQPLQNISYTKFNKALSITQYLKTSPPKTLTYDITYGPDQQRVKTFYTDTSGYKTIRYYSGSYQKDSIVVGSTKTVKKIHYIMGGTGLVAVYIKWSTGVEKMYYVCKDRQGSIMALVNQDGTIAEKYSYDAWGRRRNPANWTDFNVKTPRLISRGYTGHEYLDAFGLINMNGRMYDPVIGRVLSPDNYVQDPTNTQSYNRYSYCLNNPLRYTDPSGWFAAAADQYWNMGKEITDYISFSGMRAGSIDGTGGGGWGGNGGVLPAWYVGGDYGEYWRQMTRGVNNLCNSSAPDGVYTLAAVRYNHGTYEFTYNYNLRATINVNALIAYSERNYPFSQVVNGSIDPSEVPTEIYQNSRYSVFQNKQGRIATPFFIPIEKLAMDIIWASSFNDDGSVKCETAMYQVVGGYIILPNVDNLPNMSKNYWREYIKDGFLTIPYGDGTNYLVIDFIHTHPIRWGGIGISGPDKTFNKTVPTYIIWQGNLYDINNNKIKRVIK